MTDAPSRNGLLLGIGAYVLWGLLPLYLKLLSSVPPMQILAHRVLWSLILLGALVVLMRRVADIRAAARGRTLLLLAVTATLIAVNWFVFIWAVGNGHALSASLGYFINPLVNVALGVVVLRERLTRIQAAAIALAALGVVVMAVAGGAGALWVPLTLAISFGTYGLIRKVVAIDALGGLTVETLLLAPICLAVVVLAGQGGSGAFGHDWRLDLLLVGSGVVTALPLLMFAAAARRMPYSTLGLLQYIAPTMQFVEAAWLFGEPLRPYHAATFGLIWLGCGLFALDATRAGRRRAAPAPR
jgi:chloramphenicol-sensitive protein RarD